MKAFLLIMLSFISLSSIALAETSEERIQRHLKGSIARKGAGCWALSNPEKNICFTRYAAVLRAKQRGNPQTFNKTCRSGQGGSYTGVNAHHCQVQRRTLIAQSAAEIAKAGHKGEAAKSLCKSKIPNITASELTYCTQHVAYATKNSKHATPDTPHTPSEDDAKEGANLSYRYPTDYDIQVHIDRDTCWSIQFHSDRRNTCYQRYQTLIREHASNGACSELNTERKRQQCRPIERRALSDSPRDASEKEEKGKKGTESGKKGGAPV